MVTVAVEKYCKGTRCSSKQLNGREDGVQQEILQTKCPVISYSMVNQYESISETADREAITKSNIHMRRIKVFIFLVLKETPAVGLTYHGIRAQGWRKLPTIHPFAVMANLKDVFVIPKLPTAHSPMELFQCPVGLFI